MALKAVVRVNDTTPATCPTHGAITITFNTGSAIVKADTRGIVRVTDTGIASCGATTIATTGSTIVKEAGNGLHREGDTGNIIHGVPIGTYTILAGSGSTNVFADG